MDNPNIFDIVEDHPEWLPEGSDINKKKSGAFVLLCISTCLEMPLEEAAELITEGGNDAGVDGLHVGEVEDGEIHRLFDDHGDKLLERNIRRYLGLHTNRVNTAIHETLCDPKRSDKFYFYNNGITVVCDKFDYNAFQKSDYKVQLKNMQVINGGQTCKTIQETLNGVLSGIVGESTFRK
ncbi:AIPR family protein [Desulfobacter postgatei]|uniref:AIPR family protein n=1 Tax=Desulfobacter postgatei TaxID=2293 RepID=UPI00259B68CE|nr:AIPR family protein [uncultured Desulfobacter sp.]